MIFSAPNGLRIYVEHKPVADIVNVYLWNDKHYFTMQHGNTVQHAIDPNPAVGNEKPFISGPASIVLSFIECIASHHESQGGTDSRQFLLGSVKELSNEKEWLRKMIEKQL